MKAVKIILAGGVAAAALATAAPAAAQYYPPYPYGGGYGTGNVIGQVLNQVLGGGTYGYGNYGVNSQAVVGQCVNAVQARLSSSYGGGYSPYGGYGGYNAYGNNGYAGGARVVGISRVEPRSGGGLTVRGVASSGRYAAYGSGSGQVDLTFKCRADYRGYITDVDIDRAQGSYGYNNYTPYNQYDYSQYGYRRY